MIIEIKIPEVGESVTEGILTQWLVDEGQLVQAEEDLFELETDKVTMSIPAEVSGRISLLVAAGETVAVGQVVANIDTSAAQHPAEEHEPAGTRQPQKQTAEAQTDAPQQSAVPISPPAGMQQAKAKIATGADPLPLSPAVRTLVKTHGLDPAHIQGTGKDGRITKEDVLTFLEKKQAKAPETKEKQQVTAQQVLQLSQADSQPQAVSQRPSDRESRVKMSTLRQRITERLVQVQQEAAILSTFNEVDMSAVMAFRSKYKKNFEDKFDVRLGFMSFFVKAAVDALKTVPQLNARIDGDEIIYQHYYDIGMAVGTPKGLMVPVIREADKLSFAEIERRIVDLATRARDRKLSLEELVGGCFTISNGGVYGSLLSTPILNPPQSGILGLHRIQKRAVVVDDQIVIRPMMYLALSYDHRIVDGAEAVTFLKRIVECIEDPERILLEV